MTISKVTIRSLVVDQIREVAPSLTKRDVEDLIKLAEQVPFSPRLAEILNDYKLAGKLNEASLDGIFKILDMFQPFARLASVIAGAI